MNERLTTAHYHAEDGDSWWSVVGADGDIATGVMHRSEKAAEAELEELLRGAG